MQKKPSVTYLLAQAHFAMRARLDNELEKLGISSLQYTILSFINRHPGSSSAEIARRFHRSQQAMGQMLSALEEQGFMLRNENPSNRRALQASLTPAGKK